MMASMVIAAGNIWTDAAEITLNNNTVIEKNLTVYGGDPEKDDGFLMYSDNNQVYIKRFGGVPLTLTSDNTGGADQRLMISRFDGDVGEPELQFFMNTTFQAGHIGADTATDGLNFDSANDIFAPETDNQESFGTGSFRLANVLSVLINGADICLENQICLTETENDNGQIDACYVYGKPTDEQRVKIGVATIATYEDYIYSHGGSEDFDNSLSESEFDAIHAELITANGNYDFSFGRTKHLCLRDLKNIPVRVDTMGSEMCAKDPTFSWCS